MRYQVNTVWAPAVVIEQATAEMETQEWDFLVQQLMSCLPDRLH